MIRTATLCAVLAASAAAQGIGEDSSLRMRKLTQSDIPIPAPADGAELTPADLTVFGLLPRVCPIDTFEKKDIRVDDIRSISDQWCASGNPASNCYGLSNMMWAFGQFIDHDIVGTLSDDESPIIDVPGVPGRVMRLQRAKTEGKKNLPLNIHRGKVTGGAVYGESFRFEREVLREKNSCRLRESVPGFLPITTNPDGNGRFRFIAGDPRADEHSILFAMHSLWLREHNRLCDELEKNPQTSRMSGNRKFRIAKNTVVAKVQQVALKEWLPGFKITNEDLLKSEGKINSPRISVEFSVGFRLGHTLIPDVIGKFPVADLFDAQAFYLTQPGDGTVSMKASAERDVADLFEALAQEPAAEMDGSLSDALRNVLFGPEFQEDLASRNIFRGRDLNLPSYANMARCYGVEPQMDIERETPDAWVGLLRERREPGEPLGPTHKAMMIEQFGRIFHGKRGMYWKRTLKHYVKYFRDEVEQTTLAKIISANTGAKVSGNAFKMSAAASNCKN